MAPLIKNPVQTIAVGISGGVDSAVAALLLKKQGYKVLGIFMQNWTADLEDPYCTAEQDLSDARSVCDQIGIPLSTVNFAREYWDRVFQRCLDEFAKGRTPNPDIGCNREIKFDLFLQHALSLGADKIATGHYSRIESKASRYILTKAADTHKDQTYFLYTLNQIQLAHSTFPLGNITKTTVRALAAEHGLINHAKKDSTGICFIGERNFKKFLQEFLRIQPGVIETTHGVPIGKHDGVIFYTIGQRKGLDLGSTPVGDTRAWYLVKKDIKRNVLIVGQGHDHPLLFSSHLVCHDTHWISGCIPVDSFRCTAKTRYHQMEQQCTVTPRVGSSSSDAFFDINFDVPQRAITPGQSIVFYNNTECLGGGIIK